MIVTITANPCLDRNVLVERMVSDDTMHPVLVTDDPGGSGINVSRVLTRFERKNIAVGFLGGGTGQDVPDCSTKKVSCTSSPRSKATLERT